MSQAATPQGSLGSMPFASLIEQLGAKSPTPGGGAAAAMTLATAAALGQMVLNYSIGKRSLREHDALHRDAVRTLGEVARQALQLADADAAAFEQLSQLWKLAEDDPRRKKQWGDAVRAAIEPPMQVLTASIAVLRVLDQIAGTTNRQLDSDLEIAAILADGAARAAVANVRVNLPSLRDEAERQDVEEATQSHMNEADQLRTRVERALAE